MYAYYTDGHHKLVRWRLVTHCGIDGFTRMVVYLHCSNNNRSSTVYSLFLKAAELYGLPSRIRCDEGGENVQVAQHTLEHRGVDGRSVIVGSSVHNQIIERLWRDMHRCVTILYYRLFYYMESQKELWIPSTNVTCTHFTMCFCHALTHHFMLFKKGGTTMVFIQSTTGHQINCSHLKLCNSSNQDLSQWTSSRLQMIMGW